MSAFRPSLKDTIPAVLLATAALCQPAGADTTLLNVSYDPTRELYKAVNSAFAATLEGQDRRDGDGQAVPRRLRRAGARGDRRPRRRRGDAGARRRHRRHRRQDRQDPGGLAEARCRTIPRPTPRPSCSSCARAIRKAFTDWSDLAKPASRSSRRIRKPRAARAGTTSPPGATRLKAFGGDEAKTRDFVTGIYRNAPVLDTGARGSTITFAQRVWETC